MPNVAYNPYDKTQSGFLSALALGESSGPHAYTQGVGGTDLSKAPTDSYGFPTWGGFGNSHAAGEFQFQPSTWDHYASQYNLNFQSPSDQNSAAWLLAQDTYRQQTGGELSDALAKGDYAGVQSALASVWPSVTGNGASPGLAAALNGGLGGTLQGGTNPISSDTSGGGGFLGGIASFVANEFARFGLLIIGGLIVLVALWWLLSETGVIPSPSDTGKAAVKLATTAAVA